MNTITTQAREGIIEETDLYYRLTVTLEGQNITEAFGVLEHPEGLHEKFAGTTKILFDKSTLLEFQIFVGEERFTFFTYEGVDKILDSDNK